MKGCGFNAVGSRADEGTDCCRPLQWQYTMLATTDSIQTVPDDVCEEITMTTRLSITEMLMHALLDELCQNIASANNCSPTGSQATKFSLAYRILLSRRL